MPIEARARCGCPGIERRVLGLLGKPGHTFRVVDRDDAEAAAVFDRYFDGGQGDGGVLLLVEPHHLQVVHLVDVVTGQHDHVARLLAHDRIEVLIDGVGGALIPLLADALLRRQDLDELAELFGDDAPSLADVAVERQRLVLRGDEDAPEARVDAIAEDEIDDAVRATEVDRRFGAIAGQRGEAFADPSREHDDQHLLGAHRP